MSSWKILMASVLSLGSTALVFGVDQEHCSKPLHLFVSQIDAPGSQAKNTSIYQFSRVVPATGSDPVRFDDGAYNYAPLSYLWETYSRDTHLGYAHYGDAEFPEPLRQIYEDFSVCSSGTADKPTNVHVVSLNSLGKTSLIQQRFQHAGTEAGKPETDNYNTDSQIQVGAANPGLGYSCPSVETDRHVKIDFYPPIAVRFKIFKQNMMQHNDILNFDNHNQAVVKNYYICLAKQNPDKLTCNSENGLSHSDLIYGIHLAFDKSEQSSQGQLANGNIALERPHEDNACVRMATN